MTTMIAQSQQPYTDIQTRFWLDRFIPAPYVRLARFDRPIGAWLLFIPGLWSIWLAAVQAQAQGPGLGPVPLVRLVELSLLFMVGSIVMRGAGCVVNDLWDQDLDRQVTRTMGRPLASGAVSRTQAFAFLGVLLVTGLVAVLFMPALTLGLAVLSLAFVALYPLAKRVTYWPQAMLGLTFNFGALMGASAVLGHVPGFALVLYAGCIAWTIGYDTIYAHQDREDDLSVGIKSTALLFGTRTKTMLRLFYGLAVCLWAVALVLAHAGPLAWGGLVATSLTLVWQIRSLDIDDPAKCLGLFKFSAWTGWILFAGLLMDWAF